MPLQGFRALWWHRGQRIVRRPNTLNYYVGLSVPTPIKEITVGAAFDYLSNANGQGSWATAIAGYVSYQVSEKLEAECPRRVR